MSRALLRMLTIRKIDLLRIIEHCNREYPNEACGALAGKGSTVDAVYPLTSEHPDPASYIALAQEQFQAFREMRAAGRELVGLYHSHPTGPAYPSARDLELAYYPEAVYIIISLRDRDTPVIKGFVLAAKSITEVSIMIVEEEKSETEA